MALTGLVLYAFVVGHLLGNLQVFAGPDVFNQYAVTLRGYPVLLWIARLVLLASLVIHVTLSIKLALGRLGARPVPYQLKQPLVSSYSSRTMLTTGLALLGFLAVHLAQHTFGWIFPSYHAIKDAQGRPDIHSMTVLGFQHAWVAGFYALSLVLIGLHLSHGFQSLFQSLGVNHPKWNPLLRAASPVLAWVLMAGFLLIPLASLARWIKPGSP